MLFVSLSCWSQIKSGKIEYGLHIPTFSSLEKTKRMKASYHKAIENTPFLNFELPFKSNESYFLLTEGLGLNDQWLQYAKLFSGYMGMVYQDEVFSFSEIN
nr:hypothetical protein [Flavobacterium sp.]